MTRAAPTAELLRTLDEKFIANSIAFDSMAGAATIIVDGAPLRDADGAIDLAMIRSRFEAASWHMPAMRQRLVPTPLRATTPAWVPVPELDIARHVRLHPTVEPDDPRRAEVLTGRRNGRLDPRLPLWDILIVELDSGRVAIVGRFHHAIGDALFALRFGDAVAGTEVVAEIPEATAEERLAVGTPPRSGFGILAIAWRDWWGQQQGFSGAWHEYWRKPVTRRLRRWGGRVIRPLKNVVLERSGTAARVLAPRHSRYLDVEFEPVTKLATRLGGSVHDLVVAATLRAAAALEPERETVSLLVPISRRGRGDAQVRNHVSMIKVEVPAAATLEEHVQSVRSQVRAGIIGRPTGDLNVRDWSGYATVMPWGRKPRFFAEARVETVTGWGAGDPLDDIACLACTYDTRITVAVTTRATTDIDLVMATIAGSFAASAPVATG
jgi:diacylglycerol O-acyltransferase / wax synthase